MVESKQSQQRGSIEYEIPFVLTKMLSPEECTGLITSFKNYDKDNNGVIDKNKFRQVLKDMGHDVSLDRLEEAFTKTDLNQDGLIEWEEFI